MRCEIVPFTATDGVELTGFLFGPARATYAAIYVHGLGGNGYRSSMIHALAHALARRGMALFSINTRGHDCVATRRCGATRSNTNGAVYEIFDECVYDLRGAMRALHTRGVKKIALIGHSTGANKIAYALQTKIRAHAVVYLAPGDDVGIQRQLLGAHSFRAMQTLSTQRARKHPHALMPVKNLGYLDISAASYHSLFGTRNHMDQFPFSHLTPDPRWTRLSRSRTPACVVIGECDEYLPLPARAVELFVAEYLPRLTCTLIPGANHSFAGAEVRMARVILRFLSNHFPHDKPRKD